MGIAFCKTLQVTEKLRGGEVQKISSEFILDCLVNSEKYLLWAGGNRSGTQGETRIEIEIWELAFQFVTETKDMDVRGKMQMRANDSSQETATLKGWRFKESGKITQSCWEESQKESVIDEYKYCHAGLMT